MLSAGNLTTRREQLESDVALLVSKSTHMLHGVL